MSDYTSIHGPMEYRTIERDIDDPVKNFDRLRGKWTNERKAAAPRVIVPIKNHKGEHAVKKSIQQTEKRRSAYVPISASPSTTKLEFEI